MANSWTFSRRLFVSFAALAVLTIIMAFVTQYSIRRVVNEKDSVIDVNARALAGARSLQAATARTSAASRGYIITSDADFLHKVQENDTLFTETLRNLRQTLRDPEALHRLNDVEAMGQDYDNQISRLITLQQNAAQRTAVPAFMVDQVLPRRLRLDSVVDAFADYEEAQMSMKRDEATRAANSAMSMLFLISAVVIALACILAWFLSRVLSTQIASAVQNVQSASAELQATATQQATGR